MVDSVSLGISIASLIISITISGIGLIVAYLTLLSRINPLLEIEYTDNKFFLKNIGRGYIYNISGEFFSTKKELFSILYIYTLNISDKKPLVLIQKHKNLDFLKSLSQEDIDEEKQKELAKMFLEFEGVLVGFIKFRNEFGLKRKSYFILEKEDGVSRRVNKRYYNYWVKFMVKRKPNLTFNDLAKTLKKLDKT